jgi:deoxyribodipyrimidine photo-lyase
MQELACPICHGDATAIGDALANATSVRSVAEPHLLPWLPRLADCLDAPSLFANIDRCCDSFSTWWARAGRSRSLVQVRAQLDWQGTA